MHTRNYPLSVRDLIASVGSDVYFVDKSEVSERGAYFYIHGKILSESDLSKTIKIIDKGSFSAPGYLPFSHSYAKVRPGDEKEFSEDELHVFLSGDEFNTFRDNVEVPSLSAGDNGLSEDSEDSADSLEPSKPDAGKPWDPEQRAAWEKYRREEAIREEDKEAAEAKRKAIEETEAEADIVESDDFLEKRGNIYVRASSNLETWSENAGIKWPEKFPLPWMNEVYDKLLAGMSGGVGGREGVTDNRDSLPAVQSPGHKGLMPKDLAETQRLNDKVVEINAKVLKILQELKQAEEQLKEATKSKDEQAIRAARKLVRSKQLAFNTEKEAYLTATRTYREVLYRSPEATTYAPVHGGTSRDLSTEGNLLRQELKLLSEKYQKTIDQVDTISHLEPLIEEGRKELDLILKYRKRELVPVQGDHDSYEFIHARETQRDRFGPRGPWRSKEILDELRELKQEQFEKMPYVVSEGEMDIPVAMAFQLTGEIDPAHMSPAQKKYFKKKYKESPELVDQLQRGRPGLLNQEFQKFWKDKKPTFFDLPQTFIDAYSKVLAEDVKQTAAEKKERAEKLADKYVDFISDQISWIKLWKEIKKYIKKEYDIVISEATAKRLEEMAEDPERRKDSMEVSGADSDGELKTVRISSYEIKQKAKRAIIKPYEDRVLWLKRLQNGQENYLDQQKQELRRLSVERNRSLEKELKGKEEDIPSLVAYVNNFSKIWTKADPKLRSKLPNSDDYNTLVTRLTDLKKYIDTIQKNPELKEVVDHEKVTKAKYIMGMALSEFSRHNFDIAIRFLNNFEDIFGDLYKTPPIDDRKYREAIVAIFDRVARHSAYAREVLPDWKKRYQQGVGGERGLEKKLIEYNKLLDEEADLEKYIDQLENEVSRLSGPTSSIFRTEEEALLEVDRATSRKTDPSQSQQDANTAANQIKWVLNEMSKKRRQKDYNFKFLWNRAGARENAEKILQALNDQLAKLREELQATMKGATLDPDEKASIEKAYRRVEREQIDADDKAERLNAKIDEIIEKLDKVRGGRYALATELEMFTKGEKQ